MQPGETVISTTGDKEMTDQEENKEKKPRRVREFEYDLWQDIASQKANITFKQLFQIAPSTKQKVKT